MNTNALNVDIQQKIPRNFVRGQTLEFVMDLPCDIPAKYFANSSPGIHIQTLLHSEIRRVENAGAGGFVDSFDQTLGEITWEDPDCTKIRFRKDSTGSWPLGLVEFDVLFTRIVTTQSPFQVMTKKFRSLPISFTIMDGVSQELSS